MESTLGAANRGPLRGGRRAAVLEAGRPAQAGRLAAGFARASPFGRWRFHSALSGCPPCPRWVRTWRESARTRRPLQPSGPRAHDRRCASHLDWGSASPSMMCRDSSRRISARSSCAAKADLALIRCVSTGLASPHPSGGGRRGANFGVTRRPGKVAMLPGDIRRGLLRQGIFRWTFRIHRSTPRGRPRGGYIGVRVDLRPCSWIVE